MQQLSGKVALVTGAGSGIGRANALVMAARGAALIVNDRDADSALQTVALIEQAGGRAVSCIADVALCADILQAIAQAERELGAVDILVNNAGIASGRLPFEAIDEAAIDRMFAVTVKGAMFCTRAVLPGMKARRSGKIINTSSITALGSHKFGCNYAAAKAAVIGLTKAWAREFAEWNIQVNAVAPGRVRTPMVAFMDRTEAYIEEMKRRVPMGRQAVPEEIAGVVAFLASSDADYMTGQVISPNGGEVM
jgi:3-oxoacyl-[acyl-carrier protein] reductase